jgi:hypothetical protein
MNAAEKLASSLPTDTKPAARPKSKTTASRSSTNDVDVFKLANGVDTIAVLDKLNVSHTETSRGEMATCPGCSEEGALVCKDGGIRCMHDRCSHAGPPGHPGFRTNVDLVVQVEKVEAFEAAKLICEWNGIEVPKWKTNASSAADPHAGSPDIPPGEGASPIGDKPAPSGSFKLLDAEAIWAPLEEPEYVVDGIIRRATLTEIVSYGGSGKSWVAIDMALSVAAGVPWLGRFPTKQGADTYLDWENGSYEMRRRLQAGARGRGLTAPVVGVDVCTMPDVYLSDPAFGPRIVALAKDRDLVIVDTLKAADPFTDENDSKIRIGLDALRRTGEQTGCAFVVLVHSKKTSGSATAIDAREAGRGSSAIYDAADSVLHIQYTEGKPLRVVQTKARLGKTVPSFLVRIEDTADGGVRVWAEDATTDDENEPSAKFDKHCDEVLECVRQCPGASKRLLSTKLHKHHTTVVAALEMLQRHGAVSPTGTSKAERWFSVDRTKGAPSNAR